MKRFSTVCRALAIILFALVVTSGATPSTFTAWLIVAVGVIDLFEAFRR